MFKFTRLFLLADILTGVVHTLLFNDFVSGETGINDIVMVLKDCIYLLPDDTLSDIPRSSYFTADVR